MIDAVGQSQRSQGWQGRKVHMTVPGTYQDSTATSEPPYSLTRWNGATALEHPRDPRSTECEIVAQPSLSAQLLPSGGNPE